MCLVKMDKVNWVETAIHPITISSSLDYMYYTMYCYLRQELLCTQTYFRTPVCRKASGVEIPTDFSTNHRTVLQSPIQRFIVNDR